MMHLKVENNEKKMNKSIEILNYQKIFDEENQNTELKRLRSNENVAILIAEEKRKWEKINSQKLKLPSGKVLKGNQRMRFETVKIKLDVLKSEKIIGIKNEL